MCGLWPEGGHLLAVVGVGAVVELDAGEGARDLAAAGDPGDGGPLVEEVHRVEELLALLLDEAHAQDLALRLVWDQLRGQDLYGARRRSGLGETIMRSDGGDCKLQSGVTDAGATRDRKGDDSMMLGVTAVATTTGQSDMVGNLGCNTMQSNNAAISKVAVCIHRLLP